MLLYLLLLRLIIYKHKINCIPKNQNAGPRGDYFLSVDVWFIDTGK